MTNVPIYGCVGCSGPGGRLACPEHGFYEVVERDAEIARLQAERNALQREVENERGWRQHYQILREVTSKNNKTLRAEAEIKENALQACSNVCEDLSAEVERLRPEAEPTNEWWNKRSQWYQGELERLRAEAEVTTREAITVRTRLYEAVAEVERLKGEIDAYDEICADWRSQATKAEAVVRAAEAVVGCWGGGDMEHEYPRGQLKALRDALAAFRGRA